MKLIRAGVLAGLFAVLLTVPASAQVRAGIKGGVSSATLSGDGVDGAGSLTGFVGGAFVRFPLGGMVSLQPELLYARRGASDTEIEEADASLKLSYLELPVLLHVGIPTGTAFRPHLFAGPYFAYRTGGTIEASAEGVTVEIDCDDDDFDLEKTDIGLQFGAGFDYDFGGFALVVDGRYGLGLTSLSDAEDADAKNRAFSFMAGFSIPVGTR